MVSHYGNPQNENVLFMITDDFTFCAIQAEINASVIFYIKSYYCICKSFTKFLEGIQINLSWEKKAPIHLNQMRAKV